MTSYKSNNPSFFLNYKFSDVKKMESSVDLICTVSLCVLFSKSAFVLTITCISIRTETVVFYFKETRILISCSRDYVETCLCGVFNHNVQLIPVNVTQLGCVCQLPWVLSYTWGHEKGQRYLANFLSCFLGHFVGLIPASWKSNVARIQMP